MHAYTEEEGLRLGFMWLGIAVRAGLSVGGADLAVDLGHPGKPGTHNYRLLSTHYGLHWGIVACCLRPLGFPGTAMLWFHNAHIASYAYLHVQVYIYINRYLYVYMDIYIYCINNY